MPPPRRSPVGAHVFVAGGLVAKGLTYADRIGAEAVQVFVSNPRGWKASAGDAAADEAFREATAVRRMPVFVHSPYLVNLASPTELTCERSVAAVRHSLLRGRRIGARGVVVHAGSAVDATHHATALRQVRELTLPILDALADDDPHLLIEPTAGGGHPVAASVDDLAPLFDALESHPRLGVCLDTCHALAAGHDLVRPGGVRAVLDGVVRAVGRGRLELVHANDSKDPLGSGRDRHTNIGAGLIGTAPFGELFEHPATRGIPIIVETPGDVDAHIRDIATLKAFRDR
jgi:deoxyribonuclease-4